MARTGSAALAVAASLLASSAAQAAEAAHVSFITCPIFRNGETRCWLAEHGGVTYYIGRYGSGSAPQLLHKLLIQGTVSDEPRSCGGVVIRPVYLSVLPELDYSCNSVLPDNGDRPTGPSFYDLPTDKQLLIDEPVPLPTGPFTDQRFVGRFDHDSAFLNTGLQELVETAGNYAVAGKASHVKVTGHVGNSKLDDGSILVERTSLARTRAQSVATALTGLGVDPARLEVTWLDAAAAPDGIHDADRRTVEIELTVPRVPSP